MKDTHSHPHTQSRSPSKRQEAASIMKTCAKEAEHANEYCLDAYITRYGFIWMLPGPVCCAVPICAHLVNLVAHLKYFNTAHWSHSALHISISNNALQLILCTLPSTPINASCDTCHPYQPTLHEVLLKAMLKQRVRTNQRFMQCHENQRFMQCHTNQRFMQCNTNQRFMQCHTNQFFMQCNTNQRFMQCHTNQHFMQCHTCEERGPVFVLLWSWQVWVGQSWHVRVPSPRHGMVHRGPRAGECACVCVCACACVSVYACICKCVCVPACVCVCEILLAARRPIRNADTAR